MTTNIIINAESGNCCKVNVDKLLKTFGNDTTVTTVAGKLPDDVSCQRLVVCGGDGTLNEALPFADKMPVYYLPCGTLNEASKKRKIQTVGKADGKLFAYVLACGSFTEIGYTAKPCDKKRWKRVAYLPQVLKYYKVHNLNAKLTVDGKNFDGTYTLVMFLRSKQCFGLRFNKGYAGGNYLVAVRSPKRLPKVSMFFPFFRIFFVGVRKSKITKNWMVLPFENATVTFDKEQTFCMDGEKTTLNKTFEVTQQKLKNEIVVVNNDKKRIAKK